MVRSERAALASRTISKNSSRVISMVRDGPLRGPPHHEANLLPQPFQRQEPSCAGARLRHNGNMKIFAHRGWCAGAQGNTLASFARAAGAAGIAGIELDVRAATDGRTLLVCHDPPRPGA